MGVMTGPLSATLVRLIESKRSCGNGSPKRESASAPTTNDSHSKCTPAARITEIAAPVTSGPMPSPGTSVILCLVIYERLRIIGFYCPKQASNHTEHMTQLPVVGTAKDLQVLPLLRAVSDLKSDDF